MYTTTPQRKGKSRSWICMGTWKIREIEPLWWLPSPVPDWYYCHAKQEGARGKKTFWSWFLLKLVIALLLLQTMYQPLKTEKIGEIGEKQTFVHEKILTGRAATSKMSLRFGENWPIPPISKKHYNTLLQSCLRTSQFASTYFYEGYQNFTHETISNYHSVILIS